MRFPARFGLRTRLIAAFLLVAAISAATTATLTYREARSAILKQSQDTAIASLRDQLDGVAFQLPMAQDTLDELVKTVAKRAKPHPWMVFAEYAGLKASNSDRPASTVITPELRREAQGNPHGSFQRVVKNGQPELTVAMPVVATYGTATRPTGLVVYAVMGLDTEGATIDAMVTAARDGALPALGIALVPALLASRSVL
ncbi:two-component sensor histidine kinase, partial [Streptomyces sp. T-3]|nr:two-component sensor histidine kinase [Streptomyces sp. T-3]